MSQKTKRVKAFTIMAGDKLLMASGKTQEVKSARGIDKHIMTFYFVEGGYSVCGRRSMIDKVVSE